MNHVVLIGRLTKRPEVRYTGNEMAIARFSLAVDRYSKEDKKADFINIVVFGKQAENCERYLDKGSMVALQGHIQTGSYKTQSGETRYTTDVVADRVQFLSKPSDGDRQERREPENDGIPSGFAAVDDGDIPF